MRIALDILGNRVGIIKSEIKNKKQSVAYIRKIYPSLKSILCQTSARKGKYRVYDYKLLWGSKNTEVVHKEYGYSIKLDPRKVFFSQRESTERQRIADAAEGGEEVLVMFCGAGPYIIALAKKKHLKRAVGIDINPYAIKYAKENLKLNKISNAELMLGDVRALEYGKFDRIIMPLAEAAIDYLDVAFWHAKKGSVIHLYGLSSDINLKDLEEAIKQIAKNCRIKIKILKKEKVLPYAPRVFKARFDIKVL